MDTLISLTPDELARSAGPRLLAKCHALMHDPWQNLDTVTEPDMVDREDTLSRVLLGVIPRFAPQVYRRIISACGDGPWSIHTTVRLITEFDGAEAVLDHWFAIVDQYRTRRIAAGRNAG